MSQTYRTDGNGTTLSTATYSDPYDPLRPSSVTDANSHTTGYKWDSFGNLHEMTSPRGTVTDYTWAFPGSVATGYPTGTSITQTNAPVLGELTKVQETAGTGGGVTQKAATTYAYFDSANNGLRSGLDEQRPHQHDDEADAGNVGGHDYGLLHLHL